MRTALPTPPINGLRTARLYRGATAPHLVLIPGAVILCVKYLTIFVGHVGCYNCCHSANTKAAIKVFGNLNICALGSGHLQANSGTGLTYQWKRNNVNIAGATNRSYVAKTTGSYSVAVTNLYNCVTVSAKTGYFQLLYSSNPGGIKPGYFR